MRIEHPDRRRLGELRQLWKQVFGDSDDFLDSFFRTAFSPNRCRCILMEDKIAAVLYWMDCTLGDQKLAYLYAVATHPDHRGKGLCRQLMENTQTLLRRQGYAGVILVPQDNGLRQMYSKMGYVNAGSLAEFSCTAGSVPCPLRALGPKEFAARRRALLPQDGVIQEQEGLAFLAEQLQFYAGEDFLLAGFAADHVLHGVELLGNPSAAPGIVAALKCTAGHFRSPGGKTPFAMFLPLADAAKQPAYFGFAYD